MHAGLGDPHDLDHRLAPQRQHLPGPRGARAQDVLGSPVQQVNGPVIGQPGYHELGSLLPGQPDGVRVRGPLPLALHALYNPAVAFKQLPQVPKVVLPGGPRMITLPAHAQRLRYNSDNKSTVTRDTDILFD